MASVPVLTNLSEANIVIYGDCKFVSRSVVHQIVIFDIGFLQNSRTVFIYKLGASWIKEQTFTINQKLLFIAK